MKIYKLIFASFLVLSLMASCEKYEDYVSDYDYTTAYFGSQKPLRTIVARDEMEFEVGVALGGMREDNGTHEVNFKVDSSLLENIPEAAGFVMLPEAYYTLGDESNFNIVKDHMRVVNVSLNRETFTADPLAITNTYALPLRITSATLDSIPGSDLDTATIESKDITILVVKYISPYHGTYYSKGVQYELDATGAPVDTITFSDENLSQNMTKDFSTLALNIISTNNISAQISGKMDLTIDNDNAVEIASTAITVSENNSVYSPEETTIFLDYKFEKSGTMYHTLDTLILRQAPELDLRFDEW
ncbi:BT_3987 domain-containing protein [Saccharicrinis fermentans]|uniref:Uncharacterized protein n=1 Tax=Saccharicrinis fermentans DSM 9555 = JCM 21142 TaxID=869213 RepID=W7YK88_9BACT|nr:DUF1735 domain-containing protein [Saccharicrinis fermentans]GAF02759.1 hypothetical protein JCM21142_41401 [Saccharicrinis fermentans DSM 9555 = JCM 21142]